MLLDINLEIRLILISSFRAIDTYVPQGDFTFKGASIGEGIFFGRGTSILGSAFV